MGRFAKALTRKKIVDSSTLTSTPLNRCLSTLDLIFVGVGTTIGAGIYVLAADVARNDAGPSIVLSFLIAGIASILSGLCYAEFGARVPKAGSAYVYSYVTIGELCAFVIGWNLILEYVIGISSVARATSSYIDSLFDDRIQNFTLSTIGEIQTAGMAKYPDVLAVLTIFLTILLQVSGIKKTSWCMTFFAGLTLLVILFVVGVGFDVIATTGEEARNPSRAIPVSIISTIGICFLAYFGVSGVLTLMWPYNSLPNGGALPKVFALKGASWAKYVVSVGALCGLASSLIGLLVSLPRMLFSMAGDGLIFKFLAKVSPRTGAPVIATVVSGVLSGILALIFDMHALVEMLSIGTLMAYTVVAVCVIVLRYSTQTVGLSKQEISEAGEDNQPNGKERSREDSPLLEGRQTREPSETTASLALIAIVASSIGFVALGTLITWGLHHLSMAKWWAVLLLVVISFLLIGTTVLLLWLPQNKTPLPFMVPGVPVLPLLTVFVDTFLMLSLSYLTWIRFSVWMVIGLSIYFFYGLRNSAESERERCESADESQMT
ncbi:PREDICTED: cationic amino acid transporter 2-like isoform X2 [Acropora digitifera]|uniref:cationic amino acid transporter 2-like isoform X2 n=1 Tax=Acropora digitifera TaxID=70779 RepID=UPI00077AF367|nr:PREDICTED: cationic amino acid transporter 2-like isoform X2 [Acropora digitifera]